MRWALFTLLAPLLFGGCVDEDTLSVYGLAERYQGSLSLRSSDCQQGGWGLHETPDLTLELKQTESGGLELWFGGSDSPLYAQLCRLEEERPVGLCLYGRRLTTYQASAPNDGSTVSCLLWGEVTEQTATDTCCEQVNAGALNTLLIQEDGSLVGAFEQRVSLEPAEDLAVNEGLCGGPLSCQYLATLQVEASP